MKSLIGSLLVLTTLMSPLAGANEDSVELRQALQFLNGRAEIKNLDATKYVKYAGWVVGALGLIPIAMAPFGMNHPEASVIIGGHFGMGLPFVAAGIAINLAGQFYPTLKNHWIGNDAEQYAKESNLQYFFDLTPSRQFHLANQNPKLRYSSWTWRSRTDS